MLFMEALHGITDHPPALNHNNVSPVNRVRNESAQLNQRPAEEMLHLWGVTSPIDWQRACMLQPHSASSERPDTTHSPVWEGPSATRPPTSSSGGAIGRRGAQRTPFPREWFGKLPSGGIPRLGAWLVVVPTTCNNTRRLVSLYLAHACPGPCLWCLREALISDSALLRFTKATYLLMLLCASADEKNIALTIPKKCKSSGEVYFKCHEINFL